MKIGMVVTDIDVSMGMLRETTVCLQRPNQKIGQAMAGADLTITFEESHKAEASKEVEAFQRALYEGSKVTVTVDTGGEE